MKYLSLKLQLFYFFAIGISGATFFFPLWLSNRGLDLKTIGTIMAMTCVSKVIFGPLAANLSDLGLSARTIMSILAVVGLFGLAALLPENDAYIYLFATLIASGGYLATIPIAENITITAHASGKIKESYGRIRVVGTIAYAVLAVITGIVIKYFDFDLLIYLMLFCCAAILLVSTTIPEVRDLGAIKETKAKLKTLFKQKDFKLVMAIQILFYTAYAMQSGIASFYWNESGISSDVIGYLVVVMIVSEAAFFLSANKYFPNVPYQKHLLISSFSSCVRYVLLAFTVDPWLIAVSMAMHAITFASTHMGMMVYIREVIPANLSTRAQSAYDAIAAGLFFGFSMMAFGYICDRIHGYSFLVSAAISLIAFLLALKLRGKKVKTA